MCIIIKTHKGKTKAGLSDAESMHCLEVKQPGIWALALDDFVLLFCSLTKHRTGVNVVLCALAGWVKPRLAQVHFNGLDTHLEVMDTELQTWSTQAFGGNVIKATLMH